MNGASHSTSRPGGTAAGRPVDRREFEVTGGKNLAEFAPLTDTDGFLDSPTFHYTSRTYSSFSTEPVYQLAFSS